MTKTVSVLRQELVLRGMHTQCAEEAVRLLRESKNPDAGVQTKVAFERSSRQLVIRCRARECSLS